MTDGVLKGFTIGGIIGGITSVTILIGIFIMPIWGFICDWEFPDYIYNLNRYYHVLFYYVLIGGFLFVILFIAGFVGGGIVGAVFGKIVKEDKEYFDICLVTIGLVGGVIGFGIIYIIVATSAVLVRNYRQSHDIQVHSSIAPDTAATITDCRD